MTAVYFRPGPVVAVAMVNSTVTVVVGVTRSLEWIATCLTWKPVLPVVSTETFNWAAAPGSSRFELTSPAAHPQVG